MRRIRALLLNATLTIVSIVLVLMVFEFIVFRLVLKASDMPRPVFMHGIIKYAPSQEGVYRVANEIQTRFRVNEHGWHSQHRRYDTDKPTGVCRMAVIGDSYVEAMQVNFDASMAERLEAALGERSQVYRFGIAGAPLSQYLEMYRTEVRRFKPDLVIVLLIHNDFSESHRYKRGVYTSSFLKLAIDAEGRVREIPPTPYVAPWYSAIRSSATWRYLAYRQRMRFSLLRDLIFRRTDRDARYEANIDVRRARSDEVSNRIAAEYVLGELARLVGEDQAELLVTMDGNREAIYEAWPADRLQESQALGLNRMVATVTERLGVDFVDLQPVFEADYSRHRRRFNAQVDGHWNEYGHSIAASAVVEHLARRDFMRECASSRSRGRTHASPGSRGAS